MGAGYNIIRLYLCESDPSKIKTAMTSSESPLIRDVEHYGSIPPTGTSAISQRDSDGVIKTDSNKSSVPGFTARNAGMLLILCSQFFFACMNISVKMLNRLDPPIHALEVGLSLSFDPWTNLSVTGCCSENGMTQNWPDSSWILTCPQGITFIGCVIYMYVDCCSGKSITDHTKDCQEDPKSPDWPQRCSNAIGRPWDQRVRVDLLIMSDDLKCPHDHFIAQVYWAVRAVLVVSVFICRRYNSPHFSGASYNSFSWRHLPKGGLLHQTGCRGRWECYSKLSRIIADRHFSSLQSSRSCPNCSSTILIWLPGCRPSRTWSARNNPGGKAGGCWVSTVLRSSPRSFHHSVSIAYVWFMCSEPLEHVCIAIDPSHGTERFYEFL